MATTQRSDLFIPEVMVDAVAGALPGMTALLNTGAVIIEDNLPESERGGDKVNVPYFAHLGDFEDVDEGDPLTVRKLTSSEEEALVKRSGIAFEINNWAQRAASATDPYKQGSEQIVGGVQRLVDRESIARARETTLKLEAPTESIAYNHFVDGLALTGDEEDIVAWSAHSTILASLRKMKDASGRLIFVEATKDTPPYIFGKPVVISDKLTGTVAGTYDTLALTRGSIVFWYNGKPTIDTDKDILVDSRVAALNMYYASHMYKRIPGRTKPGVVKITTKA